MLNLKPKQAKLILEAIRDQSHSFKEIEELAKVSRHTVTAIRTGHHKLMFELERKGYEYKPSQSLYGTKSPSILLRNRLHNLQRQVDYSLISCRELLIAQGSYEFDLAHATVQAKNLKKWKVFVERMDKEYMSHRDCIIESGLMFGYLIKDMEKMKTKKLFRLFEGVVSRVQ